MQETQRFYVDVEYKKLSIKSKTIYCIALECFATEFDKKRTKSRYYFTVESNAIEFAKIINLHSLAVK